MKDQAKIQVRLADQTTVEAILLRLDRLTAVVKIDGKFTTVGKSRIVR